jgi:hypothetical protein
VPERWQPPTTIGQQLRGVLILVLSLLCWGPEIREIMSFARFRRIELIVGCVRAQLLFRRQLDHFFRQSRMPPSPIAVHVPGCDLLCIVACDGGCSPRLLALRWRAERCLGSVSNQGLMCFRCLTSMHIRGLSRQLSCSSATVVSSPCYQNRKGVCLVRKHQSWPRIFILSEEAVSLLEMEIRCIANR